MKKINTDLPQFIDSFSVSRLIDVIDEVKEDSEVSWNSFGGSTYAGQNFIDFLNNFKHDVDANVTGIAASMGAVMLPFFNKVKGAFQSDVMLHSMSGSQNLVKHTNTFLYKALAKKINESVFKEITGHKLKSVMLAEGEDRINVWLTGKEAVKVGLFDEGYDLLDKQNSLESELPTNEIGYTIPAHISEKYNKKQNIQTEIPQTKNDMEIKDITITQLQSGNPELYNAVSKIATEKENKRVSDILKYGGSDLEKANEIITSGKEISLEDVAFFTEKKAGLKKVAGLEEGSEADLVPAKPTLNQETEKEAALAELEEAIGIDNESLKN